MSGMWKRSHGGTIEAPPDERCGNRYVLPNATAPHLDSTKLRRAQPEQMFSGVPLLTDIARLDRHVANVSKSEVAIQMGIEPPPSEERGGSFTSMFTVSKSMR